MSISTAKWFFYSVVLAVFCLNSGCLVSTQSFNHGKLLNPGERLVTTGYGWKYSARQSKVEKEYNIGQPDYRKEYVYDSTRFGWLNVIFDYRVGLLAKYPFGKGIETGFHVEAAYRGNQEMSMHYNGYNPEYKSTAGYKKQTTPEFYSTPLLEIDTRFGFPDLTLKNSVFHHNFNWGWVVGQWVDNGWFWGYAAGWEFPRCIIFSSVRRFMAATDAFNNSIAVDNPDYFNKHQRTFGVRLTGGVSLKLPVNESFLPEYIAPEVSLIFSNTNKVQRVGFSCSLGIRWLPGF